MKKWARNDDETAQILAQLKTLEKVFWAWWLLPILFSSYGGGVIAWVILHKASPQKSKDLLTLGWVMIVVGVLVVIIHFMTIPQR